MSKYGPSITRSTTLVRRFSERFIVDPRTLNDGSASPTGGSVSGYDYRLPFLAYEFPVRQLRVYLPADADSIVLGRSVITLCEPDGRFLLYQVPLSRFFITDRALAPVPLYFAANFFPDPRQSYLSWVVDGETTPMELEFVYA